MNRPQRYRWNDWNVNHIAEHGVSTSECEYVVDHARAPWPEYLGNGKLRVWGQTEDGWIVQVVYLVEPESLYVIHARPLTESEKRQYRRRSR